MSSLEDYMNVLKNTKPEELNRNFGYVPESIMTQYLTSLNTTEIKKINWSLWHADYIKNQCLEAKGFKPVFKDWSYVTGTYVGYAYEGSFREGYKVYTYPCNFNPDMATGKGLKVIPHKVEGYKEVHFKNTDCVVAEHGQVRVCRVHVPRPEPITYGTILRYLYYDETEMLQCNLSDMCEVIVALPDTALDPREFDLVERKTNVLVVKYLLSLTEKLRGRENKIKGVRLTYCYILGHADLLTTHRRFFDTVIGKLYEFSTNEKLDEMADLYKRFIPLYIRSYEDLPPKFHEMVNYTCTDAEACTS